VDVSALVNPLGALLDGITVLEQPIQSVCPATDAIPGFDHQQIVRDPRVDQVIGCGQTGPSRPDNDNVVNNLSWWLNATVHAALAFLADDSSHAQGRRKVISFVTTFRNLGTDANIETSVGQRAAISVVTGAIFGVGTASLGSHGVEKGESDAQESCSMDLHSSVRFANSLAGCKRKI